MTALVQTAAAAFKVAEESDLRTVAMFSLVGMTLSLIAVHFGLAVT